MVGVLSGLKNGERGEGADEDEAGEVRWSFEDLGRLWTLLLLNRGITG